MTAADQRVNELRLRTDALRLEVPDAVWMDYAPRVLRLCDELESVKGRNAKLQRVAKAASEVRAFEDAEWVRSAIENERLRSGETLTISVGGGPSPFWQARERLKAALAALPKEATDAHQ